MNQKNSFKKIVNRPYVLLFAIILIAFLLRVIKLSDIPASLSHDEVAIGYNAWSILKTGRDEYGVKFPLLFRSFDDYKLPGYVYLTAFSEFIFGLTPFAVRFPSAFFRIYFWANTLCSPISFGHVWNSERWSSILFCESITAKNTQK